VGGVPSFAPLSLEVRQLEKEILSIGRVIRPHGVKGMMKVEYFGEDLDQVRLYREILIEDLEGNLRTFEILEAIPQPPRLILRLKGIERREEVEPLIGKEVLIKRETLPVLEEGTYYWIELIGMAVETEEGKSIGRVKKIFPTGANDVLIVEGTRGEIFLPATEEVIRSVDRAKGVVKVNRMEGLWEAEDEV
jgi:16S rRNA processing protein RimM